MLILLDYFWLKTYISYFWICEYNSWLYLLQSTAKGPQVAIDISVHTGINLIAETGRSDHEFEVASVEMENEHSSGNKKNVISKKSTVLALIPAKENGINFDHYNHSYLRSKYWKIICSDRIRKIFLIKWLLYNFDKSL